MKLALPPALAAQIAAEAKAAHPHECCGLIEGWREDGIFHVSALHPARNLSSQAERFEIDPADHLAASRAARANGHALIGCYHSHPHGAAKPSARDLAGAGEDNFVWLIAGDEGLRAFVYFEGGFAELSVATGADLVTSSL